MTRFSRTIAGKITLYILTLILAGTFLVGSIGTVVALDGHLFKSTEQEQLVNIYKYRLIDRAYDYACTALDYEEHSYNTNGMAIRILDEKGKEVSKTKNFEDYSKQNGLASYKCFIDVKKDKDRVTDLYWVDYYDDAEEVFTGQDGAVRYSMQIIADLDSIELTPEESLERLLLHWFFKLKMGLIPLTLASLILGLITFILLMRAAGRRPDTEEVAAGAFERVPFDLLVFIAICIGGIFLAMADMFGRALYQMIWISGTLCLCAAMGLALCMTLATRLKLHTFLKGLLCYKVLILALRVIKIAWAWLKTLLASIPLIWRTVLILAVISIAEFFCLAANAYQPDVQLGLWFLEKLILIPAVMYLALILRRLQKSGEKLAAGDLNYHTDTDKMFWEFRQHGENLNAISRGMTQAVEQRMKSERMKTELITNVSHDIKTPLTSIINYASLIGERDFDDPDINDYADVLVRQSAKLKRLIEDLVEASKASTGNIDVLLAPCDAGVLVSQASGEYQEKLESAGLTLVSKIPEEPVRIMADSRRIWRVFDNLMNNISKYSQTGTRVYLNLEERNSRAVITFRNTSREPLNISADELMERFVRGDSSRSQEGNGLGLSIARSLTELQNGTFELSVDGDLFKVTLTFPAI